MTMYAPVETLPHAKITAARYLVGAVLMQGAVLEVGTPWPVGDRSRQQLRLGWREGGVASVSFRGVGWGKRVQTASQGWLATGPSRLIAVSWHGPGPPKSTQPGPQSLAVKLMRQQEISAPE